jgi:hypothetical protein
VAHFLQLLHHGVHATGTDEQNAVGEPAYDVLREFLAGQQLLGEDAILGLNQTNAPVQFDGDASARGQPHGVT